MVQDYLEQILLDAVRQDACYQDLLSKCREAEKEYRDILSRLPQADRERLERYISLCEELQYRQTVLALELPRG